jgi:hypothetical protein
MQDENHGYDVKMLDVSDYSNISVLATFNSGVDPNSMAHNGIIKDDLLYLAYYHDGLRVFDINNPSNPVQVNYYDTYLPNNHNSYKGAWGVYPYLNSGNILVSDMQTGLYVFELSTSPTEIKEEEKPSYIYPNPITSSFIINNRYADLIIMYDIFGRTVRTENLDQNINIFNRNNIKEGLYLIEFYKEGLLLSSDKIIFN